MRKLWHLTRVGGAFLFFWAGGAYLSWFRLPLVWWTTRDKARARVRCRRIMLDGWHVFVDYIRVTGMATFDPRKTRPTVPEGPFVLVANHPTLVDVVAVMTSIDDLYCVVKGFYFHLPLVNRLLRYCGHIDGGDGGLQDSARVMEQCLQRLREGGRVLFFPEGTRSPIEGLHPFQRGGFEVARRAEVPLVPVILRVSQPVLKRGVPWYKVPDRVFHYDIHPIEARRVEGTRSASKQAALEVRVELLRWLDALDGVPFEAERGKSGADRFSVPEILPGPQS